MKDITAAPFMVETIRLISNAYRLGWDERNGGNLSYLLYPDDVEGFLDVTKVIRKIDMGFCAPELAGMLFLVTGTGKYFKNVEYDPAANLGIIRIADDAVTAELLWGYTDGGKFTSELSAHLMSHAERLRRDKNHRVVLHNHPPYTVAMTLGCNLDEKEFTKALWKTCTECLIVFPEGVAVMPWMVCGTTEIGRLTADKLKEYRLCVWAAHGIFATGATLDEAFGLIETVEKSAQLYILSAPLGHKNLMTDAQLAELGEYYKLDYKKEYLDL